LVRTGKEVSFLSNYSFRRGTQRFSLASFDLACSVCQEKEKELEGRRKEERAEFSLTHFIF